MQSSESKESVYILPTGLVWDGNMAAVCESTLHSVVDVLRVT